MQSLWVASIFAHSFWGFSSRELRVTSDFSAAAPSLGYLYQLRFGLWSALEDEQLTIRLEVLDDVEVISPEGGRAFLQLKHVKAKASLTDSSPDLWKTLRVWSQHKKDGHLHESDALLLITTGLAPAGSIAEMLRSTEESVNQITHRLEKVAHSSKNKSLEPAFRAFLSLSEAERRGLVSQIRIIDDSTRIGDLASKIEQRLALVVNPEHRTGARQRLEGWWHDAAIRHLEGQRRSLPCAEVFAKARDIAASFGPQALPIDFLEATPVDGFDALSDRRPFVLQLKAVGASLGRIEKAIRDYYRAFEQRARWARENLIDDGELAQYEDRLIDEWERVRLALENEIKMDSAAEEELKATGRKVLTWVELEADVRIRERVTEAYVMRGSYHMLANTGPEHRVWWHPRFRDRVEEILGIEMGGE